MTPQYIVLTVTRVAIRNRNNPKLAQAQILNPPVRQMFVLPLMMSKSQHSDHVEIEIDERLLTMAEHFDDVVSVINFASTHMTAVALPVQRDAIAAAAQQGDYLKKLGAEMRAAEGAKHQGEIENAPDYGAAQDIATWGDFVQTDGENVGAPTKRKAQRGDLRIFNFADDRFWIEYADVSSTDDNEVEWLRGKVPDELKAVYANYETARQAVKLAGYSRRLWEE